MKFAPNQQIGRFGLIRELARGGMGQVFLARDATLGRKVAIKFLLDYDKSQVGRFLVEARATARCTHENIVTIYEVGEHAGFPYMVLEYLEGQPLQDLIVRKPSAMQFAELMVPVVRALERAHEHGIVHRDLKPPNIFITERGQVKVLDFGIAHVQERIEQRITGAMQAFDPDSGKGFDDPTTPDDGDAVIGTLPYMSPEQWGAGPIDARTDLWAVGMLFWRVLAGVHPAGTIKAEPLRRCLLDVGTPLPSFATAVPDAPKALVAIVDRCLVKRRDQRYASATALLADLTAFLGAERAGFDEKTSPYRGLASFGEDNAGFFFGRSSEIRMAQAMLERSPLLAIVGASGVGKSSFVHAGLVPALRASGRWNVSSLRPGATPCARLFGAIQTTPGEFGARVRADAASKGERVLIVVDQLEELFTLCTDERERARFLAGLVAAADDPSSPVRVVLSMRADFLDRLAVYRDAFAELSRGLMFLAPPDAADLREAIVRPAELAGYRFDDPAVVDDMVRNATLPLLSFAAARLWDHRDRTGKLLTAAAYRDIGGVAGAFARHADAVAASIPPHQQPLLRAVMVRLLTPEGTRAIADVRELTSLGPEVESILQVLVDARLVRADRDGVEIVHEALIGEWPTLKRWFEQGQAERAFQHDVQQAARNWDARGRVRELVWHGAVADDALAFARRHDIELSALERAYLDAVQALAARASRRRIAILASVFITLGLVIAGGSIALVRISAAEARAKQEKRNADDQAEAQRQAALAATNARAEAEKDNALLRAEKERREDAEKAASSATDYANASREDLQKALDVAQAQQKRAEAAAAAAQKASDDAKAANERTEELLAKERDKVHQLELEKQKLYNGHLQ